jgi:hypothetical protein
MKKSFLRCGILSLTAVAAFVSAQEKTGPKPTMHPS